MRLLGRDLEWRSGEWGLSFLLLVSLAIKVPGLLSGDIINVDGVRYIDAARQFAQGNFLEGLQIDWMPFYSMLIAAVHFLIRDWVLAGQLISLFAMVFALVPLFLLTKDLFDEKVAFWTGMAFALSPTLNDHAVGLLRDPVFLFFVAWSVYFFLRALRTEGIFFFALASLSATFALFFRLEAILLWSVFLSLVAVLALMDRVKRRLFLKGMFALVGVPLALGVLLGGGILLAAGPDFGTSGGTGELSGKLQEVVSSNSLAYYKRKVGKGVFSNYQSRYELMKDIARKSPQLNRTGGVFETTRHYLPIIYLISGVEAMFRNLFPLFVLPLIAGFVKRINWHRGHWFLLLLAGAYFLLAYYFLFTKDFISKRYVLVPPLLLLPWVGLGLERIWGRLVESRWPRILMVLFLLFFYGIPAYKSVGDFTGSGKGEVLKEAGQWLAIQPGLQNAVIACSEPRIRFYSSPNLKYLKAMEKFHVARDFRKMETIAFENKADLLIVETPPKKRHKIPGFKHYSMLKAFEGKKNDVLIFSRNNSGSESG